MFKLILCVALIGAFSPLGTALKKLPDMQIQPVVDVSPPRNCPNRCSFRAWCNPKTQAYVYAIVNGRCRIFHNGCLFAKENCSRANSCLKPLQKISYNVCRQPCNQLCLAVSSPVCASFPVTNEDGTSDFDMLTFANRCELDRYACLANRAYVNEPTPGACA